VAGFLLWAGLPRPVRPTHPTAGLKSHHRGQETFGPARGRVGRPAHNRDRPRLVVVGSVPIESTPG